MEGMEKNTCPVLRALHEHTEETVEDKLERAYTACKKPVHEIYAELRQVIRDHLESQGFIVELVKRKGTSHEKIMPYFFIDKMLSFEQVRNGVIRNQSDAMRQVESKKSQVMVNMDIADQCGLSYSTIEKIRWRER